jgi:hypothetical protein
MVIVLEAQEAVTPAGRPAGVPIPVAPVVVCVMAVRAVLRHTVGLEEAVPTVFDDVTDIVADAEAVQPLLSVTVTE